MACRRPPLRRFPLALARTTALALGQALAATAFHLFPITPSLSFTDISPAGTTGAMAMAGRCGPTATPPLRPLLALLPVSGCDDGQPCLCASHDLLLLSAAAEVDSVVEHQAEGGGPPDGRGTLVARGRTVARASASVVCNVEGSAGGC